MAEKLAVETDEFVRAALVFCLGLVADHASLLPVQRILEETAEAPSVRMAAGFGLIAAMNQSIADKALAAFCGVIVNHFTTLITLEEFYGEYLSPLGAPVQKDRLLDCLQREWSSHQRGKVVQALLTIYAQLPTAVSGNIRVGWAYYFEGMVRLAFPDGKLAPITTIRDLNDIQRRILEAFQQYDMPSFKWNTYVLHSDYRMLLGFDFKSEADFLDFMSGERSAHKLNQ